MLIDRVVFQSKRDTWRRLNFPCLKIRTLHLSICGLNCVLKFFIVLHLTERVHCLDCLASHVTVLRRCFNGQWHLLLLGQIDLLRLIECRLFLAEIMRLPTSLKPAAWSRARNLTTPGSVLRRALVGETAVHLSSLAQEVRLLALQVLQRIRQQT